MIEIKQCTMVYNYGKWYAVTDKGSIWGGSKEIVERKIKRLGAKEIVFPKDKPKEIEINEDDWQFPF